MSKYILVTISGIHTQVALKTKTKGYTIGVLEAFMPDAEKWGDAKSNKWISENNKRMKAICKMLNDNGL